MVRGRHKEAIELDHKRYTWKEGEEGFVATEGEDWIKLVTFPMLGSESVQVVSGSKFTRDLRDLFPIF